VADAAASNAAVVDVVDDSVAVAEVVMATALIFQIRIRADSMLRKAAMLYPIAKNRGGGNNAADDTTLFFMSTTSWLVVVFPLLGVFSSLLVVSPWWSFSADISSSSSLLLLSLIAKRVNNEQCLLRPPSSLGHDNNGITDETHDVSRRGRRWWHCLVLLPE